MKKTYISPELCTIKIVTDFGMLAGSGVANGSTLGNEYNESDVSYGRDFDFDDEE